MRRHGIDLRLGDPAEVVDPAARTVTTTSGAVVTYDALVLATGSSPFVPPVPGIDKKGFFVYRTIEDLEQLIGYGATAHARRRSSAAGCSASRRPRRAARPRAWRRTSSSSPRA